MHDYCQSQRQNSHTSILFSMVYKNAGFSNQEGVKIMGQTTQNRDCFRATGLERWESSLACQFDALQDPVKSRGVGFKRA